LFQIVYTISSHKFNSVIFIDVFLRVVIRENIIFYYLLDSIEIDTV